MRILLVVWDDAVSVPKVGWKPLKTIRAMKPARIRSVGWELKRTKRHLTLVAHTDGADGDGDVTIPLKWIVREQELVTKRGKR